MNNEIQKFDFKGAPLRTLTDKAGEPWFVAKDVCDILGTDTRDLHKILESDEITNVDSIHIAQNGGKAPLIISEPGLYRLVMKSRKPEAKEFQRWVTHEVLPSIRKHGGYMAGQERMTPEQMALASMRWLQSKVDEQAKQLKAQEGKVLFANAVETARTSILVGDFAKILKSNGIDIGPRRLFAWLRDHGWLIKAKGSSWNMPTQKAMDLHLFEVKETTISHSDGHTTINKTPNPFASSENDSHKAFQIPGICDFAMSRRFTPRAISVSSVLSVLHMAVYADSTSFRNPSGCCSTSKNCSRYSAAFDIDSSPNCSARTSHMRDDTDFRRGPGGSPNAARHHIRKGGA